MEVTLYTFEDRDGQPVELESFHGLDEANDYAQVHGLRLIQETYEYTDSVILADFTTKECSVCGGYSGRMVGSCEGCETSR